MKNPRTLAQIAASIRKRTESLSDILAIGADLIEAKEQLPEEERWLDWLSEEFDFSWRSAQNYMSAQRLASKNATVAYSKLTSSALYWLATAELPVNVLGKILRRAKHHRITEADAKSLADKARAKEVFLARHAADVADVKRQIEAAEILDGPPPELPLPEAAPSQPLPALGGADELLSDFIGAISALKRASTKPAERFRNMPYSPAELRAVAEFLNFLADASTTKVAA
jgi:hypothetical protein